MFGIRSVYQFLILCITLWFPISLVREEISFTIMLYSVKRQVPIGVCVHSSFNPQGFSINLKASMNSQKTLCNILSLQFFWEKSLQIFVSDCQRSYDWDSPSPEPLLYSSVRATNYCNMISISDSQKSSKYSPKAPMFSPPQIHQVLFLSLSHMHNTHLVFFWTMYISRSFRPDSTSAVHLRVFL